jgi:GDPmannose 4,6-dehydratase
VEACENRDYQIEIGKQVIAVDPKYFRPTEVDLLIGDPTKSNTQLGWQPKYNLGSLISEMVAADVARVKRNILLINSGFSA